MLLCYRSSLKHPDYGTGADLTARIVALLRRLDDGTKMSLWKELSPLQRDAVERELSKSIDSDETT